jgi:hypothetical protein
METTGQHDGVTEKTEQHGGVTETTGQHSGVTEYVATQNYYHDDASAQVSGKG